MYNNLSLKAFSIPDDKSPEGFSGMILRAVAFYNEVDIWMITRCLILKTGANFDTLPITYPAACTFL
jgi:hypothetical protein